MMDVTAETIPYDEDSLEDTDEETVAYEENDMDWRMVDGFVQENKDVKDTTYVSSRGRRVKKKLPVDYEEL